MTFNETAFAYLVVFVLWEFFVALLAMWIPTELRILLGDHSFKMFSMTKKALKNEHSIKPVLEYLNENAKDGRKAKRLYFFYYISFVPALIGIILSVVGLFTNSLNDIFFKYYIVLFIYTALLVLSPVFYKRDL